MAGGLGSFLLFIKQNLDIALVNDGAVIMNSSYMTASMYNSLIDKKIIYPIFTISDHIEIAIPIIPQLITEKIPVYAAPVVVIPVTKSITNSSIKLTQPISPGAITPIIPAPHVTPIIDEPISKSITNSYKKLTTPINPNIVIRSKKHI